MEPQPPLLPSPETAAALSEPAQNPTPGHASRARPTHVVGIGASAGGLEALEAFFTHMPPHNALAFVVVQHLSPDFKSLMDQLLVRYTQMPVVRVEDNTPVEAGTIYLLTPRKDIIIVNGILRLTDQQRSVRGINLPIDTFFTSLAQDMGDRAIGIVLSGAGSDGTRGLRDVKEHGGLVIVQDVESAKFDSMPRNALATGLADHVMPPEQMPQALLSYVQHRPQAPSLDHALPELTTVEGNLRDIVELLRQERGVDFTHYKPTTLLRRIYRRMGLIGVLDIESYTERLRSSAPERQLLRKDLLIGVTHFFRDDEAFQVLAYEVLPTLVQQTPPDGPLRLWVAACSTGEEAYSIAMLLHEQLERLTPPREVKIFATDVDQEAIAFAANGVYPESIAADVSPERLQRFFVQRTDGYQVARSLRETVLFAVHDLTRDPPFTKMALVSCRNYLIYIDHTLQQRVLALLYYAIQPQGFLWLGPSETLGEMGDKFQTAHAKWKVFQKSSNVHLPMSVALGGGPQVTRQSDLALRPGLLPRENEAVPHLAYASIVEAYSPPALVVNEHREVLWIVGDAATYLKVPAGRVSTDVLRMLREELSTPVAIALYKIVREKSDLVYDNITLRTEDEGQRLRLRLKWVPHSQQHGNMILLFFEAVQPAPATAIEVLSLDPPGQALQRLQDLERELQYTQENLQATIEELESSNEELQATNEELIAANEELQSTNEELHSVNEELYTVNTEYQSKIQELMTLNDDVNHLLQSTDIGTIFLDEALRVRKFTPAATAFVPLVEHDIGRPLAHLAHTFVAFDLLRAAEDVLQTGERLEQEVTTQAGAWVLLRILPFLTQPHTCTGVVLSCVDITHTKRAEQALAMHVQRLETVRTIVTELTRELDLSRLLNLIMDRAVALSEAAGTGALFLWDEPTRHLRPQAWTNMGEWMGDVLFHLGEGLTELIAQQSQVTFVEACRHWPQALPAPLAPLGRLALMAEPVLYRDQLIGVIVLCTGQPEAEVPVSTPATPLVFTPQDRELLSLFASQAAIALMNAQSFAAVQRR